MDDGEIPFEIVSDLVWTERAYQMLSDGTLAAQGFVTDGVASAHVWGSCPRCEHRIDYRQTISAPVSVTRGGNGAPRLLVDVICGCGLRHRGALEGQTGCGVTFRVPARPA